ncbi:MAG: thiamine-phosphate kinase [Candidatus Gastranaerophilales bacterium]|nr:thiamine-phosphate kinase [Candidatus Gastranaerophilales bacterium]
MNKENIFLNIINKTISDNSFLGDDCAYIKELNLLASTDALVEDVHFNLSYFTPFELGKKSVLVNVSDILSNGGVPKFITISLSGNLNENFIEGFYKGADEICQKFDMKIIGGDLTGGDKINVSICILGGTKNRKIPSRKNAKPGYLVFLKGYHGESAMGLKLLLDKKNPLLPVENEFIKAHKEPFLFPEISDRIALNAKFPYAMTDTSDGLYDSLERISLASKVGFRINYDKIQRRIEDKNLILFGGEDYGLLICLNPKDAGIVSDVPCIGTVTDDRQILIDNEPVKTNLTFNHFN